jgi:hypothetical protein
MIITDQDVKAVQVLIAKEQRILWSGKEEPDWNGTEKEQKRGQVSFRVREHDI